MLASLAGLQTPGHYVVGQGSRENLERMGDAVPVGDTLTYLGMALQALSAWGARDASVRRIISLREHPVRMYVRTLMVVSRLESSGLRVRVSSFYFSEISVRSSRKLLISLSLKKCFLDQSIQKNEKGSTDACAHPLPPWQGGEVFHQHRVASVLDFKMKSHVFAILWSYKHYFLY